MELVKQLQALNPTISKLLSLSGSPALSLGVLHHGDLLHTAHFGHKHVHHDEPPNDDSIFHIASFVKLLTAGVVAHLVDDGKLDWDTPMHRYLPEFRRRADSIGREATVQDFLSNRTGLAVSHASSGQQKAEFLIPRSETAHTAASLEAVAPFREQFIYSQWNYSVVTDLVEVVSGQTFEAYTRTTFLYELGMTRTHFGAHGEGRDDVRGHGIRDDATAVPIASPGFTTDTGYAGAGGCKSSLHDLMLMYQSFLASHAHQQKNQVDSTPGSPWKYTRTIVEPYIHVGSSDISQVAYSLGLYRLVLPTNLSIASLNQQLFNAARHVLPGTGHNNKGLTLYHHTAAVPGFHGSMFLVPSTESAVVVLTNSLPLIDPTDFVAQLLLSILIGEEPREDEFLRIAEMAQPFQILGYQRLTSALEKKKTNIAPSLPLSQYEGDYWNAIGVMAYSIKMIGDYLQMTIKGRSQTSYDLLPYDGNTFYWKADREWEMCEKGMWPFLFPEAHKVHFRLASERRVEELIWHHDPLGKPEVFRRKARQDKANL